MSLCWIVTCLAGAGAVATTAMVAIAILTASFAFAAFSFSDASVFSFAFTFSFASVLAVAVQCLAFSLIVPVGLVERAPFLLCLAGVLRIFGAQDRLDLKLRVF